MSKKRQKWQVEKSFIGVDNGLVQSMELRKSKEATHIV